MALDAHLDSPPPPTVGTAYSHISTVLQLVFSRFLQMVGSFEIGEDATRVAVMSFSEQVRVEFRLDR